MPRGGRYPMDCKFTVEGELMTPDKIGVQTFERGGVTYLDYLLIGDNDTANTRQFRPVARLTDAGWFVELVEMHRFPEGQG